MVTWQFFCFLFLARKCEILRDYFFHAQQEVLHKGRLGQVARTGR